MSLKTPVAMSCSPLFDPAACVAEEKQRWNGPGVPTVASALNKRWLDKSWFVVLVVAVEGVDVVAVAAAPPVVEAPVVGVTPPAAGDAADGDAAVSVDNRAVTLDRKAVTDSSAPRSDGVALRFLDRPPAPGRRGWC